MVDARIPQAHGCTRMQIAEMLHVKLAGQIITPCITNSPDPLPRERVRRPGAYHAAARSLSRAGSAVRHPVDRYLPDALADYESFFQMIGSLISPAAAVCRTDLPTDLFCWRG